MLMSPARVRDSVSGTGMRLPAPDDVNGRVAEEGFILVGHIGELEARRQTSGAHLVKAELSVIEMVTCPRRSLTTLGWTTCVLSPTPAGKT